MIVIVDKFVIDARPRYSENHILNSAQANMLNEIWLARLLNQIRSFITKNSGATPEQVCVEAKRLQNTLVLDHNDNEDIIEAEALEISKEKILLKLSSEGLPAPNNLDLHASELATSPEILIAARLRVEARLRAGTILVNKLS